MGGSTESCNQPTSLDQSWRCSKSPSRTGRIAMSLIARPFSWLDLRQVNEAHGSKLAGRRVPKDASPQAPAPSGNAGRPSRRIRPCSLTSAPSPWNHLTTRDLASLRKGCAAHVCSSELLSLWRSPPARSHGVDEEGQNDPDPGVETAAPISLDRVGGAAQEGLSGRR